MNAFKLMELLPKYESCPKCGNYYLGKNEGKLVVEDDYLYRSCKCGWSVKVNDDGDEV